MVTFLLKIGSQLLFTVEVWFNSFQNSVFQNELYRGSSMKHKNSSFFSKFGSAVLWEIRIEPLLFEFWIIIHNVFLIYSDQTIKQQFWVCSLIAYDWSVSFAKFGQTLRIQNNWFTWFLNVLYFFCIIDVSWSRCVGKLLIVWHEFASNSALKTSNVDGLLDQYQSERPNHLIWTEITSLHIYEYLNHLSKHYKYFL